MAGVEERRDASSRASDNGNAMSRVVDIKDASSRTLDDGECLVLGGGGRPTKGKTSTRTADGRRPGDLEHIYYTQILK